MLLLLIPTFAIVFSITRDRKRDSVRSAKPFEELQRRPAGESTRLQLEKHSENLDMWLMGIVAIPVVFALALTLERRMNLVAITLFFLVVAMFAAVAERKIRSLLEKCRCCRLGFEGERYVAEELNQLMADGFRVFHDVPFDTYNIDHVLVGPTGVFVSKPKHGANRYLSKVARNSMFPSMVKRSTFQTVLRPTLLSRLSAIKIRYLNGSARPPPIALRPMEFSPSLDGGWKRMRTLPFYVSIQSEFAERC